jgi:membrane protein DedA with SNARE-associated domain
MDLTQFIFETIKNNGGISVIVAGLLEQIIVPIPSPIVPMAAGFLFVPQNLTGLLVILKSVFIKAALPFAIGSTIGSTMVYLASWYGGKWLINKFSNWLEITWEDVEAVRKKYFKGHVYDEIVIFLSRAIPVVPSVLFSAACGAIRINPASFYIATGLGLLVRGMLLGWLGWQSGEALFAISEGLDKWEMIVSIGLVGVTGLLLLWAYTKRNQWLDNLQS